MSVKQSIQSLEETVKQLQETNFEFQNNRFFFKNLKLEIKHPSKMNQELKVMGQVAQTPELSALLNKFEQLNIEISELANEIAYRLSTIKTIPVEGLTKSEPDVVQEPQDVISHFYLQLSNLASSKRRLEDCFNHIKTIV